MKKSLIVFCAVTLIAVLTLFAYNSDKGLAKQKNGIAELPQPVSDSVLQRGKYLVDKMNYSDQDIEAIAAYLNSK